MNRPKSIAACLELEQEFGTAMVTSLEGRNQLNENPVASASSQLPDTTLTLCRSASAANDSNFHFPIESLEESKKLCLKLNELKDCQRLLVCECDQLRRQLREMKSENEKVRKKHSELLLEYFEFKIYTTSTNRSLEEIKAFLENRGALFSNASTSGIIPNGHDSSLLSDINQVTVKTKSTDQPHEEKLQKKCNFSSFSSKPQPSLYNNKQNREIQKKPRKSGNPTNEQQQQNKTNYQNERHPKPKFSNLDGLFQKLQSIPNSVKSSSDSLSSDKPQKKVKTLKELADEELLKTLELEELKNRKLSFETLVNLPKFRETFTRVDTFLFHCKVCRKDKPIKLRAGSDNAKLFNHVACQQHKKSLEAPQIDGINSIEALNRALILNEFYFVNVAEDNKQYFCELCEKVFIGRGMYKLIQRHEGTKVHLTKERDTFGVVFSRQVEYDDEGQIVLVNSSAKKIESPEEKLQIMHKVHDELKNVCNNIFALKEIEMNVNGGDDGTNPLKTLKLTCTKCGLAFDPLSYYYYLKRNVVEHLLSERHRQAVRATKRKRNDKLGKQQNNQNNNNHKENVPKPIRVRYHRKKIQKLTQ